MKKLLYFVLLLALLIIFPACTKEPEKSKIEISYSESEIRMFVGDTINIKPIVTGNEDNENYVLQYQLSDELAEIDEDGNLTAIEEGILEVYVTVDVNPDAFAQLTIDIIKLGNGIYRVSFDVNGGETLDSSSVIFEKGEKVELPTPVREGHNFLGWYDENDELVTEIKNKNYNLVAKWESLDLIVNVSYTLPTGVYLSNYTTRQEFIDDLIKDIQSIKDSSFTYDYLKEYEGTGYGIFIAAEGASTFFSNDDLRAKWGWMLEYTKSKRSEEGLDVSQYDNALDNGYVSKDAPSINLELIAFITQRDCDYITDKVSYETCDYSSQYDANNFWQSMSDYLVEFNLFKKEMNILENIPQAIKVGHVFEGWYSSSDFSSESKITNTSKFDGSITLYPKFEDPTGTINVSFDYNGGINETLYQEYGTKLSTIVLSGYNGDFFGGESYKNNIFISNKDNDPKAKFATRIYITLDEYTKLYKIISIQKSGEPSSWPAQASYVITISNEYFGTYDDDFKLSKIATGKIVTFNKDITSISNTNLGNVTIYDNNLKNYKLNEMINSSFEVPNPIRIGYSFNGWYDDFGNHYNEVEDFSGMSVLSVYALWNYTGQIVGEFEDNSWVIAGNKVQLLTTFIGESNENLKWESLSPEIATVDQTGLVTGVEEGLATIIVSHPKYPEINFTFYITVFNEDPTGILKLLVDSHNSTVYNRNKLIIGIITEPGYYYANVVGSVSKLLFEDYVVHKDYYLSNPNNKSTLTGENSTGIDFITFHYAADMGATATDGGSNLASWNKGNNLNGVQASWHYGTGNDGVWLCQSESYGAWHAGSSKAMRWYDTGLKYKEGDPEFPKITLGEDNYFYLNGQKTKVANTTEGKRLNNMGLAHKIENGTYYISGCYYNTSYKYISSVGGNNNSIGIESSCAKGSDLWLTWQYSAQLCADLLLKNNLPLTRLVGHHFFSGKWCPQPMLEYDMEIWWEFVELVRQEMTLFSEYSDYELSFSSDSEYLKENGRVSNLPNNSQCVTYTITYTIGNETKTVKLSSILPGLDA